MGKENGMRLAAAGISFSTGTPEAESALTSSQPPRVDVPEDSIRFEIELEFVQCLARPSYLNYLAMNRYFENPAFLNYLKYLKYWQRPEYVQFIVYPHALAFLDILDSERFRQTIAREDFTTLVHSQQFYHWQYFLNNRYAEAAKQAQEKEQGVEHMDTD